MLRKCCFVFSDEACARPAMGLTHTEKPSATHNGQSEFVLFYSTSVLTRFLIFFLYNMCCFAP